MVKMDEFSSLDATALAALVRERQVKAIELVDAAIERIERLNPTLNAGPPAKISSNHLPGLCTKWDGNKAPRPIYSL